ncbi:hypothetical protein N7509_006596 [Penicillium cosmopolitanum]|uniref:Uncharacterized protein n=1 Tax=Penicillium cosmopolitanum TaxID=1131564 RepID=A0A9W9VXK7_9EURO|nr:uncharacterized protein N7509_006596 [Penicillium cosmopolitanum]KAJ5391106.1 hypothetical protein N7509_006596 [Penicillium cosmopolitanum]
MVARLAAMMSAPNFHLHHLPNLLCPILGHREIAGPDAGIHDTQPLEEAWGLRSGIYTPKQLVESFAPLLDTVIFHLGDDPRGTKPARTQLLDNIAANLATNTREATLRLTEPLDISRREMNAQATRIGKTLVRWARDQESSSKRPVDVDLQLRSSCEGHLLTPSNVDLMFGDRSQPHLMQLFNEYMHQMVLLRDALLPFQNYQDVLIPINRKARGLRHLEPARSQFLADMLTRHTTQRNVVTFAKALLAPELVRSKSVGYGFQYAQELSCPHSWPGGRPRCTCCSMFLSEWMKRRWMRYLTISSTITTRPHELRSPPGIEKVVSEPASFSEKNIQIQDSSSICLVGSSQVDQLCRLEMRFELGDGKRVAVDVGQISRGHRYSYMTEDAESSVNGTNIGSAVPKTRRSIVVHNAVSVLEMPDSSLLTAKKNSVHVIPTESPLIAFAILGKLYPGNVVLLPSNRGISLTDKAGKGFESKFVIWGGAQPGGLKGVF